MPQPRGSDTRRPWVQRPLVVEAAVVVAAEEALHLLVVVVVVVVPLQLQQQQQKQKQHQRVRET